MIQLSRKRNNQYALISKDKTKVFLIFWLNALNRAQAIQRQIVHNDWYTQNNRPLHISAVTKLLLATLFIASVQLYLEFLESEIIPEREEIHAAKPTEVSSSSYQSNIKVYK
jgi:hypothetical protein